MASLDTSVVPSTPAAIVFSDIADFTINLRIDSDTVQQCRVVRAILRHASTVWRVMLDPNTQFRTVTAPLWEDDDTDAMLFIFSILHSVNLPPNVGAQDVDLYQLAVIADKYDLAHVLKPHFALHAHSGYAGRRSNAFDDERMTIAYVFDLKTAFMPQARYYVCHAQENPAGQLVATDGTVLLGDDALPTMNTLGCTLQHIKRHAQAKFALILRNLQYSLPIHPDINKLPPSQRLCLRRGRLIVQRVLEDEKMARFVEYCEGTDCTEPGVYENTVRAIKNFINSVYSEELTIEPGEPVHEKQCHLCQLLLIEADKIMEELYDDLRSQFRDMPNSIREIAPIAQPIKQFWRS